MALLLIPSSPVSGETPAFQGHTAEMAMRDPTAEQRRRALFFDAVDVEVGEPWLSCDHVATARPDAVAGTGHVARLSGLTDRTVTVRVWFPPGLAESLADAQGKAIATAGARLPGFRLVGLEVTAFAWCR